MTINLSRDTRTAWKVPFSGSELRLALSEMAENLLGASQAPAGSSSGFSQAEPFLELALLDESEMARLNEDYLGCAGPTNVLAFPALADLSGEIARESGSALELGWLAVCPSVLRREALLYGQDLGAHALRLLAHGLAHLFGFEHGADMDRAVSGAVAAAGRVLKMKGHADALV